MDGSELPLELMVHADAKKIAEEFVAAAELWPGISLAYCSVHEEERHWRVRFDKVYEIEIYEDPPYMEVLVDKETSEPCWVAS
jgi:hypothetical protein